MRRLETSPQLSKQPIWEWCFAAALLATVLAVIVPFSPRLPGSGLDPSWSFAVNQAVAQNLVFGKDIVFTFGPYASIYTLDFHPSTDALMLWGGLYFGCSFFVATYLNFRHSRRVLQFGVIIVFAVMMWSRDGLLFFYPLLAGVFLAKGLVKAEAGGGGTSAGLLFFLFAPLGLLPLIKISAVFAVLCVVVPSAAVLLWNRMWMASFVVLLTPILSALLFWSIAGQPAGALLQYFLSSAAIIEGYGPAMSKSGALVGIGIYLAGTLVLMWSVLRLGEPDLPSRAFTSLMFAGFLFLAFKAGFVRNDQHALVAATAIVLAAFLAATIRWDSTALSALRVSIVVACCIGALNEMLNPGVLLKGVKSTYAGAWDGLRQRIEDPLYMSRAFEGRLGQLRTPVNFPPLPGTTDIYSRDQSYLFASGNLWNPRPVFQSYSAYLPELAASNRNHLRGKSPPDNLIIKLQPLDDRLPALEDGASWLAILGDYVPVSMTHGYLILTRSPTTTGSLPQAKAIIRKTYDMGDSISMPGTEGLLIARIHLKLTLWGRVATALFKPSELRIGLTMAGGEERHFRVIAGMAEQDFLLSPLIETANEFGLIYSGDAILQDKTVKSIVIEDGGQIGSWARQFEIELFSVPYSGDAKYRKLFKYTQPENANLRVSNIAATCHGTLDPLNGWAADALSLRTQSALRISGWLAKPAATMEVPKPVYLSFMDEAGRRSLVEASPAVVPEVAIDNGIPALETSGFSAAVDVSGLKGHYTLELGYLENGSLLLCPQVKRQLTFGR